MMRKGDREVALFVFRRWRSAFGYAAG